MVEELQDYGDTITSIEARLERLRHDVELLTKIIKDESSPKGMVMVVNEVGADNSVRIGNGKEYFKQPQKGPFLLVGFPPGEAKSVVKVTDSREIKGHLKKVLDKDERVYLDQCLSQKGLKGVAELFQVDEEQELDEEE